MRDFDFNFAFADAVPSLHYHVASMVARLPPLFILLRLPLLHLFAYYEFKLCSYALIKNAVQSTGLLHTFAFRRTPNRAYVKHKY